jgi:putative solute:sodium symporter small subunit
MSSKQDAHWAKTKSLTFTTLGIWAVLSFVIHWFGEGLNSSAFPGAYFMAGMGSQIAFAILVFWFASRQNQIDEEFGFGED